MKTYLIVFAVLGLCAFALKLLTPWVPIDIMLALSLWVGAQWAHTSRPKSTRVFWLSALGLAIIILASDAGFYAAHGGAFPYPGMFFNQFAIFSLFILGRLLPSTFASRTRGLLGMSVGVLFFFMLSNLGVFLWGGLYPHTPAGLLSCYAAALPFVKWQWISNLGATAAIYSAVAFPVWRDHAAPACVASAKRRS